MHITLDQEQWEVGTGTTLGEVFADISERAHARARIVTSLAVDHRNITDRDIDASLLAESTARFTRLTATSQSMQDIVRAAQDSAHRYAAVLRAEGLPLVHAFRSGQTQVTALDLWLGKLADYLELMDGRRETTQSLEPTRPLSVWVQELLEARSARDTVLMADLLEYEILPRLEA
jgi:hypothetical protein